MPFWCPFLVDPHQATHHSYIYRSLIKRRNWIMPTYLYDFLRVWWTQEPVLPGSFLRARAIGLMPMIDQEMIWLNSYLCIEHCRKFSAKFICISVRDRKASHALFLEQGEKDDKIIAVCADDPEYRHFKDIKDLPPHRLAEIRRFFEDCKSCSNTL